MGFGDIPLGKFLKVEDGETEIVAFVGEPELVKNSFGELGMVITCYHLDKDEWWPRQWGMSGKTARALHDFYKKNGEKWPAQAVEVSRMGEMAQTLYFFKLSATILPPTGLVALTKVQLESTKWERDNIPASASAATSGADAAQSKNAAMRLKYRIVYGKAADDLKADLLATFGDPETCPEEKLREALDFAAL